MNAETSTEQVAQGESREDQEAALEETLYLVHKVTLEMENRADFSAATRDILSQVKNKGLSFTLFSFFWSNGHPCARCTMRTNHWRREAKSFLPRRWQSTTFASPASPGCGRMPFPANRSGT